MSKIKHDSKGAFIDLAAFNALKGEQTKGGGAYIGLEVGQAVTGLVYVGPRKVETEDGNVDSHTVSFEGADLGLPLGAVLNNQVKELSIRKGDTFALARLPDTAKKKGKGKGRMMRVYKIIVTRRAK